MNAGKLFKDKKLSDIENQIDQVISKIPNYEPEQDNSSDVINSFLDYSKDEEVSNIFRSVMPAQERISRYNVYNELHRAVPIVRRILRVYLANILPKNPADGTNVVYREIDEYEDEHITERAKRFCKQVVDHHKLIDKLKTFILPTRLLYGDCFVEVININEEKKNIDFSQRATTSSMYEGLDKMVDSVSSKSTNNINLEPILTRLASCMTEIEISEDPNNVLYENEKDKPEPAKGLSDILLKVHKPHNIIILTTKYGTVLGYLEIAAGAQQSNALGVGQSLSNTVNKITSIGKRMQHTEGDLLNRLIYHVLSKILTNVKDKNVTQYGSDIHEILKNVDEDVYKFLSKIFIEQGIYKKNANLTPMNLRFIPSSRMVQFKNPSGEYFPYGESIVESLVLPCKLYLLAQLSNSITKLSRSAVVRKWTIDVGSTQQHTQLFEKLKRELYNTRITLDDISSFSSMPKILSDFKDMFLLSKQGQTPVDLDLQSFGDPSIRVEDLEDARREIIALSGIPAPNLGYMDAVELREQLVH